MRLNSKCSIAIHCLIFIYEYENKMKVTSEKLAKSAGCNPAAIRSILNALQKAGILSIARGVGGACLTRSPDTITIWDIYHTLEPEGLNSFVGTHPNPNPLCPIGLNIESILENTYHHIGIAVQKSMEEITLQRLLDEYHSKIY